MFKVLDVNSEYTLFRSILDDLWDLSDSDAYDDVLAFVFESGLEHGKLFVSEHLRQRIGPLLGNSADSPFPLDGYKREFCIYDALSLFDSHIGVMLHSLRSKIAHRTDYSSACNRVAKSTIQRFGRHAPILRDLDESALESIRVKCEQLDAEYMGFFTVFERISPVNVNFNKERLGFSDYRCLLECVFSFGCVVAESFNDQSMIRDLLPIYSLREKAFNADNGPEIMELALKNPIIRFFHKVRPFEFRSNSDYLKAVENSKKTKPLTEEESRAMFKGLLDDINTQEHKEQRRIEEERECALMADLSASINPMTLDKGAVSA